MGDSNSLKQLALPLRKARALSSFELVEEVEDLGAAQVWREVVLLSTVADSFEVEYFPCKGRSSHLNKGLSVVEMNSPLAHALEARENTEQCRFTRAVLAHNTADLVAKELE